MKPRRGLERRLFWWLFAVSVVPAFFVLVGSVWIGARTLDLVGSLGPWEQVAESARTLLDQTDGLGADAPPALREAAERHRAEVSESLGFARRWSFLGERAAALLPFLLLMLAVLLAALALWASRRIARGLTRSIRELVGWAEALGREEPLPAEQPRKRRDVEEVRVLRDALRRAAAEREQARRRALEAERTRAWGEMARRVAHEMKNPLTPLRLAAHRLRREGGAGVDESLIVIEEETRRLEDLAAQFSELGRPPEGPASPVDLDELLRSVVATDVPEDVVVRFDRTSEPPVVEAHYEPLMRAFRNLVRNGVEAMDGAAERQLTVEIERVDAGVRVRIEDTGHGLPHDAVERIFEPDFTTKSRGTGLGLALARQTVQAAGGALRAYNGARGAIFEVSLPTGER